MSTINVDCIFNVELIIRISDLVLSVGENCRVPDFASSLGY
jgi:hypothetical protein